MQRGQSQGGALAGAPLSAPQRSGPRGCSAPRGGESPPRLGARQEAPRIDRRVRQFRPAGTRPWTAATRPSAGGSLKPTSSPTWSWLSCSTQRLSPRSRGGAACSSGGGAVRLLEASSTMFDGVADGLRARGDQHNESDGAMTDVAVACSQSNMSDRVTTPKPSAAKSKQEREKGFRPSQYKTRLCRRCVPRIYKIARAAPLGRATACAAFALQRRLSAVAQQDAPAGAQQDAPVRRCTTRRACPQCTTRRACPPVHNKTCLSASAHV